MLLVLMLLPVVWTAAPTSVIRSGMATAVHSTTIDVNLKLLPCFLSDLEKRLKNWPLIKGILIIHSFVIEHFFFGLEGSWGQPQGPNFPSPWATMLALRLDCSTAAITTPQKVLPIWKLVELKMLDFSDHTRTGISILTSAADKQD